MSVCVRVCVSPDFTLSHTHTCTLTTQRDAHTDCLSAAAELRRHQSGRKGFLPFLRATFPPPEPRRFLPLPRDSCGFLTTVSSPLGGRPARCQARTRISCHRVGLLSFSPGDGGAQPEAAVTSPDLINRTRWQKFTRAQSMGPCHRCSFPGPGIRTAS